MEEKNFKRKTILINKKLQLKYTSMIVFALLIMLALAEIQAFFIVREIEPNIFSSTMGRHLNSIFLWLILGGVVVIILVIWFTIYFSHRIAGPLYRIEKDINDIIESKNFDKRIVLREKDELFEVAETINKLLDLCKTELGAK